MLWQWRTFRMQQACGGAALRAAAHGAPTLSANSNITRLVESLRNIKIDTYSMSIGGNGGIVQLTFGRGLFFVCQESSGSWAYSRPDSIDA